MHILKENEQLKFRDLTIAQQVMFLIESVSKPHDTIFLERKYRYSLIGACLADLKLSMCFSK